MIWRGFWNQGLFGFSGAVSSFGFALFSAGFAASAGASAAFGFEGFK